MQPGEYILAIKSCVVLEDGTLVTTLKHGSDGEKKHPVYARHRMADKFRHKLLWKHALEHRYSGNEDLRG